MCLQGSELTSLKQANIHQFAKKYTSSSERLNENVQRLILCKYSIAIIEIDTIYQTYPYLIHEK